MIRSFGQAHFTAVETEQAQDSISLFGKIGHRLVHRDNNLFKLFKVFVMSGLLLYFSPKIFDRIVIRGVRRQAAFRDPVAMVGQEFLGHFAGVIFRAVVNQKPMLPSFAQTFQQKRLVTLRVELALKALIQQPTRKILNQAKDFVGLAFATRLDLGLLAFASPGVGQRPPLGKTGFVAKPNLGFPAPGLLQNPRPILLNPGFALGFVQVVGDEARLLERKIQVPQQFTDIKTVVALCWLPLGSTSFFGQR